MNARQAIERLYSDKCTVTVRKSKKNPATKVTEFDEVTLLDDEPCRVSFSTVAQASKDIVSAVTQVTKLFISPDIKIPPGSKIEVTRQGSTVAYCRSGEPAVYSSHQEIVLELFKDHA